MEKIKEIIVKNIMSSDVVSVSPESGVVEAFEALLKNKISCLPVVNQNNETIGIVTTTDIGYNLIIDEYTLETTIADVMTKKVVTIKQDESAVDALKKMDLHGDGREIINQLPVINSENKLVGILSDGDILRAISKLC
ncbi:CBS domain-containing protein [Methanococcus maripaludis]|uniref:Inosine-5'-monophosphate dehydrogenase n=1 Tax=Methanococcus maripaludis TaxID=39152 RepID=A0A2L1CAY3_METMI|nr:CBS domain-containing protein [Methanococcus maripaludis]AVB76046.1 Inosine-5'-monophosphate dehydrogenase [Methanococcus maripaludis]MBA2860517.1 putative transcriptional regulator [Methanococcus maripaludis]MBA2864506.1 putative transcriptional regulator [Methanococcus maripaludis]MBB6497356.1 putative transcriptional regulator [Methanococcus maripaludis]